jgi:hypothetical protein
MPNKDCPNTICLSDMERHALLNVTSRVIQNMAWDEEMGAYFLERRKLKETFQICLTADEFSELERFIDRLRSLRPEA